MRGPAWLLLAGLLASHTAVGWQAWVWATERAELREVAARAALEARLAGVSSRARAAALALQEAQAARAGRVEELEDEASADPAAAGRMPSADSLRRLRARWGAG
ncbi:hypothetical protein [Pseudodonghicola flavimaris]|uniref:Uncharacterized protein n=1 Tax=Pseudodonghicola flavimaris TaxID=3050036 RepID=A0ABT7EZ52_9RHOB|nr:hypothetical protein [Pseudodonghicola flavimaris]MDK3017633.1 hypothetical protein [Pseudodonghicola flavimaris]